MSFRRTPHQLDNITTIFDKFIGNLEDLLKKIRPRTNVKNTRIGRIRRDLDRILELDTPEMTKLFEIVIKLNQLNVIFDNDIRFNDEDIIRLVEGDYDLINDDKIKTHDYVFEFLMGVRFALANDNGRNVSLSGQGDITIGGEIAIECKNIRSASNLLKNVDKAKKQIEERVTRNEVQYGFIALDISNIFPTEKSQDFLQKIFEDFYNNHAKLKEFQRFDQNIVDSVLEDRNFQKIIQSYIMHEAETALYSALPFRYKMGSVTLGVTFQVNKCFVISDSGLDIPLPIRGMTYKLNDRLSKDSHDKIEQYIQRLAVGF